MSKEFVSSCLQTQAQNEGIGFYAKVPRIVRTGYEMLSHAEKWLYVCLKDLCGEAGECWRSLRTLSKETGLSIGSLSQMIPHLAKVGLIQASKQVTWHIKIVNIWVQNLAYCSKNEHHVQEMNGNRSENEQECSNFVTKESSMKNKQSSKMNNEECVLPPYIDGYTGKDQTPSPDTHTHDTLSQLPIATEAIAPWLQEGHTWEEERDILIQSYEAYWEALLIHRLHLVYPSCYTEDDSLDGLNEIMREESELGREEEALEQMSTDGVEKQASAVDKEVTQEPPSRVNTDLWQEEGTKPASEAMRAVAQKDAELIAEEVKATFAAPAMATVPPLPARVPVASPVKKSQREEVPTPLECPDLSGPLSKEAILEYFDYRRGYRLPVLFSPKGGKRKTPYEASLDCAYSLWQLCLSKGYNWSQIDAVYRFMRGLDKDTGVYDAYWDGKQVDIGHVLQYLECKLREIERKRTEAKMPAYRLSSFDDPEYAKGKFTEEFYRSPSEGRSVAHV